MPTADDGSPTTGARVGALLATIVLLAATLLLIYRINPARLHASEFAYTQDDAYLDLTLARDLTGTTSGPRFGETTPLACSPSVIWPLILTAAMRVPALSPSARTADEIALIPLVINVVAAVALVLLTGHLLRREVRNGWWMFGLLVGMGLLLPLPLIVMAGTGHVLHAIVMLLVVAVTIEVIEHDIWSWWLPLVGAGLTVLNVALRYESLIVVAGTLLWAWLQGRTKRKLLTVIAALSVPVLVGVGLLATGAAVLPNAVLTHAANVLGPNWHDYGRRIFEHALAAVGRSPSLWLLTILAAALLAMRQLRTHSADEFERGRTGWLFVFVFMVLVHAAVGRTGQYRNEAFLIPVGVVAIGRTLAATYNSDKKSLAVLGVARSTSQPSGPQLPEISPYRGMVLIAAMCLLTVAIVAAPTIEAFFSVPSKCRDAFVRDRVAASFVRTYFPEGPVAVNQPGTIGYETQAGIVDLSGLTNVKMAKARLTGEYTPEYIERVTAAKKAQLALIAGSSPKVPIPASWTEVGGWYRTGTGPDSNSAVRVYSVTPVMEPDVRMSLELLSEAREQPPGMEYWFVKRKATTAPAAITR